MLTMSWPYRRVHPVYTPSLKGQMRRITFSSRNKMVITAKQKYAVKKKRLKK